MALGHRPPRAVAGRHRRLTDPEPAPPADDPVPELPEAETITREISGDLQDRRITAVRVTHDDILMNREGEAAFARDVVGRRVTRVERRAKYPLLWLDDELVLEVQLRMTGRLMVRREPPDPSRFSHVEVEMDLDDGTATLYYDDQRRLGGFRLLTAEEWTEREGDLGPEPVDPEFGPELLSTILDGRRAAVKNLLMDQRRLAGVGNIYASESLHRAGVDPRRPAGSLGAEETRRLCRSLQDVLEAAIRHFGTSFRDYVGADGRPGDFQNHVLVYGREGEPCPGCGSPVRRIVQSGRSTFFCPDCQA